MSASSTHWKFVIAVGFAVVLAPSIYAEETPIMMDTFGDFDEVAAMRISKSDAKQLEEQVADDPDDIRSRSMLIAYYGRLGGRYGEEGADDYVKHLLYVIARAPRARVLESGVDGLDPTFNPVAYTKAAKLWEDHAAAYPEDSRILSNAAHFFLLFDSDKAEQYLLQAHANEPDNADYCSSLAQLYKLRMVRGRDKAGLAKTALGYLEKAYAKADADYRDFYLTDLPVLAFESGDLEKASEYAKRLLEQATSNDDWNRGNAIHHGHLILGRIALKEGDVETAKSELLEAGKTPGSPQLNSFGPNMELAQELLEAGETDAVLQYFDLCAEFWKEDVLKDWAAAVKGGRTPNFNANLIY